MLKSFIEDHQNDKEKLQLAIQTQDFPLWLNIIHALKGCSGSVGAELLSTQLELLEKQDTFVELVELPELFSNIFSKTFTEAAQWLKQQPTSNIDTEELPNEQLQILFNKLRKKLDNRSFDFDEEVLAITNGVSSKHNKLVLELIDKLEVFDYLSAINIVQQLQTELTP